MSNDKNIQGIRSAAIRGAMGLEPSDGQYLGAFSQAQQSKLAGGGKGPDVPGIGGNGQLGYNQQARPLGEAPSSWTHIGGNGQLAMGSPLSAYEQRTLDTFDYHVPTPAQIERIAMVRRSAKMFARTILDMVPNDGADRLAALRYAHEAMMTANKAIVCEADQ